MGKDYSEGSINRSIARGAGARGTSGITNNGRDAYKKAKQSTRGHYRVSFSKMFEGVTDKDIELRHTYGKDLVSSDIGVPVDMLTLQPKRKGLKQTLTSLDEVFYVRVGKEIAGKLSIRTQRIRNEVVLIYVFQVKKTALKRPQKAFSRNVGFKKRTKSQKQEANRKSYRTRRGGTR